VTYLLPAAFAAMTLAALRLPEVAARWRGALGLPAFALGAASLPYLADIRGPELTVWISAALLLLGPAVLLLEAVRQRARLRDSHLGTSLLLLSVAAALVAAWPALRLGGVVPALLVAGALALACQFAWLAAEALGLGRALRWLGGRTPVHPPAGVLPGVLVAGALACRLAWYVSPLWVQLLQPVGVGLGVLAAWSAVPGARWTLALAGASLASAWSLPEVSHGAWIVLGVAALGGQGRPRATAALAAAGWYLATAPLLGAEVVFNVLLTGAATAQLAMFASRAGATGSR
jgi:hypothetical protein